MPPIVAPLRARRSRRCVGRCYGLVLVGHCDRVTRLNAMKEDIVNVPQVKPRRSDISPIKSLEDAQARVNRAIEDGDVSAELRWTRIALAAEARARADGLLS